MYSATGQLLKANCRWYEYTLEPCGTTGRSWAAAMATTRLAYKTKAAHTITPVAPPLPSVCSMCGGPTSVMPPIQVMSG